MTKAYKTACAPSEDSDQPGHPPSLIRVIAVRMKRALVLSYSLSAHRRLIRLGGCLRWAHMPFCRFCHALAWFILYLSFVSLWKTVLCDSSISCVSSLIRIWISIKSGLSPSTKSERRYRLGMVNSKLTVPKQYLRSRFIFFLIRSVPFFVVVSWIFGALSGLFLVSVAFYGYHYM